MPSPAVLFVALRELTSRERAHRSPEPDLVMADPDQVAAYTRAGREDGVMAPVYLFHAANACEVIRPGDTVVDLACGPATQLAMVARLNPGSRFLGVDLSDEMLTRARDYAAQQGLENIEFQKGDVSALDFLEDASVDAVISSMALHHLPDEPTLEHTFREVARVLKPGGGLYLVDFGHLKARKSIEYFANQYADRQPAIFTEDYRNSLWAAFPLSAFKHAARHLDARVTVYSTFIFPFMVATKSPPRRQADDAVRAEIAALRAQLPAHHQRDLKDLISFFRLGGLRCALL